MNITRMESKPDYPTNMKYIAMVIIVPASLIAMPCWLWYYTTSPHFYKDLAKWNTQLMRNPFTFLMVWSWATLLKVEMIDLRY